MSKAKKRTGLALAGCAVAAVFAMSAKKASATDGVFVPPAPAPPAPKPPAAVTPAPASTLAQVIARVVAAAASRDPAVMRAEAAKLRLEGWPSQASDLEELARRTESLQPQNPMVPAPVKPPAPAPAPVVVAPPPAPVKPPAPVFPSPAPNPMIPAPVKPPAVIPVASAPKPPAAPVAAALPVLQSGSTGSAVNDWQNELRRLGWGNITANGSFGSASDIATRELQTDLALQVDGVVGPLTRAHAASGRTVNDVSTLGRRVLQQGSRGLAVKWWQLVLLVDGFTDVVDDGNFGPISASRTKQWQSARGLTADGKVGPMTVAAIGPRTARIAGDVDLVTEWRPIRPVSPLPGVLPEQAPTEVVPPLRALAARVAHNLFFAPPGTEDRALITEFQLATGCNPTGAYGPGTAEQLIAFGFVPPAPRFWPSKHTLAAKAKYRAALVAQARRDAARQPEWNAAARALES